MSVRAWEDTLVLKTYLLGPEDPLPHWERTGMSRIYPYTMQDDLTDEVRDVPYRALHIENDYLHCIALPQLGGHLYSLYDKLGRREVFYRNNVVRYGLVARRGAWISGGIEFNFPQGHSCVTVSPVASHLAEDPEADTASITVGTTDLVSRMRWSVKLSLAEGEARLRQDVMLHNPTPIRQRHYFWANSAVPARDDLRLVYPATKCRTLGGEHPYPIHDGRDMSLYRNHERPNDIFALDVTEDFFGCYYEDLDVGLVHWSDHRLDFGKKFFTWGTADEGMIWVDLLTDDDGQYIELQSGRFVDQSTFEFLYPYQCARWTEYWYPIRGMGGWCWANDTVALDLRLDGRRAEVALLANETLGQADLVLDYGGGEFWRSPCYVEAGKPVRLGTTVPQPDDPEDELGVSLHVGGASILRSEHPPRYLRQPPIELPRSSLQAPENPAVTAEELAQHGLRAEKVSDFDRARELHQRALAQDAGCVQAHLGLGMLDLRADLPDAAIEHLRAAIARDPDCDEAWYYLGLAYFSIAECDVAQDIMWRLVERSQCRVEAAIALLPWLPVFQRRELLEDLPRTPTTDWLWADACLQESAQLPEDDWPEDDPLSSELAAQRYLRATQAEDVAEADRAWQHLRTILLDDPHLWLELAYAFMARHNWPGFAGRLLERAVEEIDAVRESPLVIACRTICIARRPPDTWAYWKALRETLTPADLEYAFPSRPEELGRLRFCQNDEETLWPPHYLQGNLLASLGRRAEALESWQAAARIDDSNAILCRNLGLAYHLWEEDHATALAWYDKAVVRRPGEYRLYLERDRVLSASAAGAEQRLAALEPAPDRWEIAARRVECLVDLSRWDEALALMQAYRFRPWEGARQMHALWTRALCGRAESRKQSGDVAGALADYELALTYPRNLGVGRAAYPQEAKVRWLAAECADQLGDEHKARELLESAAEERHARVCEADLYTLRALRALGRELGAEEIAARLRAWAEEHANHRLTQSIREELD